MSNFNFLANMATETNNSINTETVKHLKKDLRLDSTTVVITIKNIDDMLGVKIEIQNPGEKPISYEIGAEPQLLEALMYAVKGNRNKLTDYDPTEHTVEKGSDFKGEILNQLLASNQPIHVQKRKMEGDTYLIEVSYQLGYRRKMKIFFAGNDSNVISKLKEAELLAE